MPPPAFPEMPLGNWFGLMLLAFPFAANSRSGASKDNDLGIHLAYDALRYPFVIDQPPDQFGSKV
jgi:hypothetical protein